MEVVFHLLRNSLHTNVHDTTGIFQIEVFISEAMKFFWFQHSFPIIIPFYGIVSWWGVPILLVCLGDYMGLLVTVISHSKGI